LRAAAPLLAFLTAATAVSATTGRENSMYAKGNEILKRSKQVESSWPTITQRKQMLAAEMPFESKRDHRRECTLCEAG
jgi:hypothetical protein